VPVCHSEPNTRGGLLRVIKSHWPLAPLLLVAAVLLFTNLGADYLWEDEGDTAVLARSILQHGVPTAWDGVTFTDPDYGQREAFGFVMVSHPWLQYYVAAASFALFGDSSWAARLPFAVGGLATIIVVYAMGIGLLRSRTVAFCASLLVAVNVQFLLFSRQARNYSLNALLTCLIIWQFCHLKSRRDAVVFALLAIVLFHAHPIGLVTLAALGALTLISARFAHVRRWYWSAAIAVMCYATPWLLLSRGGYEWNTKPATAPSAFPLRLLQFGVEAASVAPLVGLSLLTASWWLWRTWSARSTGAAAQRQAFSDSERKFVISCTAVMFGQAAAVALTHSRDDIWIVGLHHTPAIIPLTLMLTALMAVRITRGSRTALVGIILLLLVTRVGQAVPWAFWAEPVATRDPSQVVTFHVPSAPKDRILKTTPVHYIRSLTAHNPGVIERISTFLRANADPSDVVVTNYEWEALYFHTGLPQGARIARSFPIYARAREAGLPEYVFGAHGVRWIVWRRAWPAYFDDQDCSEILRSVTQAGLVPRLALSVQDTLFENRENVHFRPFPGNTYIFPWYSNIPDALVYQVETYEEAVESYRRHPPEDFDGSTNFGVALIATGLRAEAVPQFRRALVLAPGNAVAHRNLANLLLDLGETSEAASHAARAVELHPDDPAANDAMGRALALQGHFDLAIARFAHALQMSPGFTEARDHLEQVQRLAEH
jgi:4-amino-4-deoxy-L-arabinose transferase-like glycosyltransferase/tetratricopeptide (TPR) repeat protein